MVERPTEPLFDTDAYSKQTEELVTAMEETTHLFTAMSENMSRLSESFENFGQTDERQAQPTGAAD